jgi:uncharacterized protein
MLKDKLIMFLLLFVFTGCIRTESEKLSGRVQVKKIMFQSEGSKIIGNLYLPGEYKLGKRFPAVIVSGSWTTVKEQMAGLYARKLAEKGFVALAFDFRNYGESEGKIRFYESPELKIMDIKNAAGFLRNQKETDIRKIGALGICAGAGYTLVAASEDKNIKTVATVAAWLHDGDAVKLFYGGEDGVRKKIAAAKKAKQKYAATGEIQYIPAISTTDKTAAMFGNYDYYLNPKRGAVPEWDGSKFAVMSWEDWLTFNPMPCAKKIFTPVLMVHTDGCVLPEYAKKFFNDILTKNKKLVWPESKIQSPMEQFDFYDNEEKVNFAVKVVAEWFNENMGGNQ